MKRIMLLCVTALMALAFCAPVFGAQAEQTTGIINYTMELSNNRFTRPEEVTVTIKATNTSDQDMPGPVTLYYPDGTLVQEFGSPTLAAGQSQSWTGTWEITENELNRGRLTFALRWYEYNDAGEIGQRGVDFSKSIIYVEAEPSVEVNRYITPSMAREGQEVNVTYEVVNTGTVDISNVTIRENKDISKTSGIIQVVAAGERASYTFAVKMGKKDLTSSATISYRAGNSTGTLTKEEATIKYGDIKLTASLKADKKGGVAGDTVKFTLTLKNTGNADYQNVTVSDAILGEIFTGTSVPANQTVTLEKEITITGTESYQFVITGQDAAGMSIETATESVSVVEIDPAQAIALAVEATADRETVYELPGVVRINIKVTNNSQKEVKNVSVSVGAVTLHTFDTLQPGQTREFTRDVNISMAGQFRFDASARDELDETQTFSSNILQIMYAQPTAVPTDAPIVTPPAPRYEDLPTSDGLPEYVGTVEKIIGILNHVALALAAICVVLLLVGVIRRIQANRRAQDHLERSSARIYDRPAPKEKEKRARKETASEEQDVTRPIGEDNEPEVPEVQPGDEAVARDGALMEETLKQLYERAGRPNAKPEVEVEEDLPEDAPAEEDAPEGKARGRRSDDEV